MKDYQVTFELDNRQWSEFVAGNKEAGVFQTPEMYKVFSESKNMEPVFLAILDKQNCIKATVLACIIKTFDGILGRITSRAIIWGGPVVLKSDPVWLSILLEEYVRVIRSKAIFTEFRNGWDMMSLNQVFEEHGFRFNEHLNILVDLTQSEEKLWRNLHSKRRNEIRKAVKRGTVFKEITEEAQVVETFEILKEVYHNAKIPLADKSMFISAFRILGPKGMIRFFAAMKEGRIIGTIIVLCYKNVIYDWYAGSYRNHYKDHPNDLLPWEVFLWGKRNGYRLFDFGGAGDPKVPYGVRDYKKKFNKKMVRPGRYRKIHNPIMYEFGRFGFKLYQGFKAHT